MLEGIGQQIEECIRQIPSTLIYGCIQVKVNRLNLSDLVRQEKEVQFYISSPDEEIYCSNAIERLLVNPNDNSGDISQQIGECFDRIYFQAEVDPSLIRLYGGRSFNTRIDEMWAHFGYFQYILPMVSIIQNSSSTVLNLIFKKDVNPSQLEAMTAHILRGIKSTRMTDNEAIAISYPTSKRSWNQNINKALDAFSKHSLEKVVLSRVCKITTTNGPAYGPIIKNLKENFPQCYIFLFQPTTGIAFFGASPELLFEKRGLEVHSFALAGTQPRGTTNDTDDELGRILLHREKETNEHIIVIDSIVKLLTPLSDTVHVGETHLLKLSNLQHLKTEISCDLNIRLNSIELLKIFHPTPALGGEPRDAAMEFININESHSRGWYGSPLGWINMVDDAKYIVSIRSALNLKKEIFIYAGAGIIEGSDPEEEWMETELKFQPMLEALRIKL